MGREVKRVALNFEWPLETVWEGFLNPYYKYSRKCSCCNGTGESPEAKRLSDRWYGYTTFRPENRGSVPFTPEHPAVWAYAERQVNQNPEYYGKGEDAVQRNAERLCGHYNARWMHHLNDDDVKALVDAGRLMGFTHTFVKGEGWKKKEDFVMPSASDVNAWSLQGFGHDSINQWVVVKAECERLGVSAYCKHCDGGTIWEEPHYEKLAEDWEPQEPPSGEGYQIWETVTEGSPISPVFSTPEALADWMTGRNYGADKGSSYESWLQFIRGPGWAPSMVISGNEIRVGPDASL